jgi:hypothetical protein
MKLDLQQYLCVKILTITACVFSSMPENRKNMHLKYDFLLKDFIKTL